MYAAIQPDVSVVIADIDISPRNSDALYGGFCVGPMEGAVEENTERMSSAATPAVVLSQSGESTEREVRKLTVSVEMEGENEISAMELMRCVRELCGGLVACRFIGRNKYEMSMSHPRGKDRLMEGFKMGDTRIHARELTNDELVVSFLNLPFYIGDEKILEKLKGWGVSAASPIKRRMWPGTNVADGTRFMKVRFNNQVQSLPYSTKFETALGSEYFRVIHDKQVRVCRMCIQPGHIMRECPEFQCHRCGIQGHFARECSQGKKRCEMCKNLNQNCSCKESEAEGEKSEVDESGDGSESENSEDRDTEDMESVDEGVEEGPVSTSGAGEVQKDDGREEKNGATEEAVKVDADKERGEREPAERKVTRKGKRDGADKAELETEEKRQGKDAEVDAGRRRGEKMRAATAEEKDKTEGKEDGADKAGMETEEKEEKRRGKDKTGERRKVTDGATPTEAGEESHASQTVDSETDMELSEKITQIRKRQNTERHNRMNKKSKNKNKK